MTMVSSTGCCVSCDPVLGAGGRARLESVLEGRELLERT